MLSTTLWLFCLLNAPGILVHGYFTTNNYFIYFTFIKLLSIVRNVPCLMNDAFSNHYIKRFFPLFFVLFWCFYQIFTHFYVNILGFFPLFSNFFISLEDHCIFFANMQLIWEIVQLINTITCYTTFLFLKHCSRQF